VLVPLYNSAVVQARRKDETTDYKQDKPVVEGYVLQELLGDLTLYIMPKSLK
jgi:hypothetical protein